MSYVITFLNSLVLLNHEAGNVVPILGSDVDPNPGPGSDHDKGPMLCNSLRLKSQLKSKNNHNRPLIIRVGENPRNWLVNFNGWQRRNKKGISSKLKRNESSMIR